MEERQCLVSRPHPVLPVVRVTDTEDCQGASWYLALVSLPKRVCDLLVASGDEVSFQSGISQD